MKFDTEGITVMRKEKLFEKLMKDLNKAVNPKTRNAIFNSARKEKKPI